METAAYQQTTYPKLSLAAQIQAKEADVQALVEFNRALDKKVSSALYRLRQQNNHPGSMPLVWPRPVTNFVDPSVLSTFDRGASQAQDSGFLVNEIIESSRIKARTMVDAAIQAMIDFSGIENTSEKIEAAIDYVNDRIPLDESSMPAPPPDPQSQNMSDRNEPEMPSERYQ